MRLIRLLSIVVMARTKVLFLSPVVNCSKRSNLWINQMGKKCRWYFFAIIWMQFELWTVLITIIARWFKQVTFSMLEIYNEQVRDLLVHKTSQKGSHGGLKVSIIRDIEKLTYLVHYIYFSIILFSSILFIY